MKNKLKSAYLLFVICAVGGIAAFAQDVPDDKTQAAKDPQLETLLYGIDTDVLTVLGNLQSEKNGRYNDVLTELMQETRNSAINQAIFRLWDDTSYEPGLVFAREELMKVLEDDDYDNSVVLNAISFISHQESSEASSELYELALDRNNALASAAIRAIGKLKDTTAPETLLDRLKKEDPVAQDDLVASLIVTLGELKYEPAADELIIIAEDSGASAAHRRFACVSLGRIGREADYPIVERLYFEEQDATLRSYALAGLAEFPQYDSVDVLVQALKRDSYWRIRVTAAEKLAGKPANSVRDLLMYKASGDPVPQVRIASLKSLGTLDSRQSRQFLIDFFKDKKNSTELRLECMSVLIENRIPGTVAAIAEVMENYWAKDEGRFLEFLGRNISRIEWSALGPLYNRMLEHQNWLLQVYGIRGIRRNNLETLAGKVEKLDREGVDGRVRREVQLEE